MDDSIKEERSIIGLEADAARDEDKEDSLEERKARLLRQAEFYRVGIVHARAGVKQGARPEALFHSAIDHATWAVRSRVDSLLRPTGMNVGAIMPFAVSMLGYISKRRLVKPAIGVLAVAAAVAVYLQQRRARSAY